MPEELTPGVYIDEPGPGPRSIEGVATSTLGMTGATEWGPVAHPALDPGSAAGPVLVTGMDEFARVFGGMSSRGRPGRLAHAARLFFANGGRRLYVQRVFVPTPVEVGAGPEGDVAGADLPPGGPVAARWRARWPGSAGGRIRVVTRQGAGDTVDVEVHLDERVDTYAGLSPSADDDRFVATVLRAVDPADEHGLVRLELGDPAPAPDVLLAALLAPGAPGIRLHGGSDGGEATAEALAGAAADPVAGSPATGLAALGEVGEIALVALPDGTDLPVGECIAAAAALVAHCEQHPYRFALVDPPEGLDTQEVLDYRARFDSSRAAIYHPWLLVTDPDGGGVGRPLAVPPSGAVAGVYARVDLADGVHRAPAGQALAGLTGLAAQVTPEEQELLNPAGVDVLRSFAGRGHLVWGARTMSSDPEWKYVNLRRYVAYLEHSIERGTQWAVFEPNGEALWTSVRRTVEDFLLAEWRSGALLGQTPRDSFLVHCDRTTMTQDDLDKGRLVVVVGFALLRPAEFVVIRVGQWTADADDAD